MTIDSALKDADHKMEQAVSHLKEDLAGIRTGRASASVLNRVTVEYYGTPVPLNQLPRSRCLSHGCSPSPPSTRAPSGRSRRRSSPPTWGSPRPTTAR